MLVAAGCCGNGSVSAVQKAAKPGAASITVSYRGRKGRPTSADGALVFPAAPKNTVAAVGVATDVVLPCFDSPSIAGERATVVLKVKAGSIPGLPACTEVRLKYDSYTNPFTKDKSYTLQFLPNGDFWGVDEIPLH